MIPLAAAQAGTVLMSTTLWVLMLVAGFVLVVVEIYLPGFGVPGIAGTLLVIGGLLLCAFGNLKLALILMAAIIALLCVVLSVSIRSASKGRLQKSDLILRSSETPQVSNQDLTYYVDRVGKACTVLRPTGFAEFDGVKLNVMTCGDFILEGSSVRVERVEGNKIIVVRA